MALSISKKVKVGGIANFSIPEQMQELFGKTIIKIDGFEERTISSAYVKVSTIHGDKNLIKFTTQTYFQKDGALIDEASYDFAPSVTLESENFIKQAYEYLKTLSEFQNARDC